MFNKKCNDCKHLLRVWDMQLVWDTDYKGELYKLYYCPEHKKEYDRVNEFGDHFKELKVDRQGVPVGYVKITEKPLIVSLKADSKFPTGSSGYTGVCAYCHDTLPSFRRKLCGKKDCMRKATSRNMRRWYKRHKKAANKSN